MGFFGRRKLSEYESNNYQQQLNEFKYKITKFEDRLDKLENDLECKSQVKSFQPANVINAEEAANRVEKAAQKALPHELREAFDEINSAIENEQQRVRLYPYKWGTFIGVNGKPQRKRIYHIDTLSKELKNMVMKPSSTLTILTDHTVFWKYLGKAKRLLIFLKLILPKSIFCR